MPGGVIQLTAYGAQDVYLTNSPQITFFKTVYRRYSSFAMEYIQQIITGTPAPGSRVSVSLNRSGDLLSDLFIEVKTKDLFYCDIPSVAPNFIFRICSDLGHAIIDQVEMEIGGQVINRHYSKWLTIWRDLTEENPYGVQSKLYNQNCTEPDIIDISYLGVPPFQSYASTLYQKTSYTHQGADIQYRAGFNNTSLFYYAPPVFYIPMRFWFCNHPGLALPLIALQYQEVKLNITFTDLKDLIKLIPTFDAPVVTFPKITNNYASCINVYGRYIYLDSSERKQFAQEPHEYLIEQVQYQNSKGNNIKLNFNHPVKELIWTGGYTFNASNNYYNNPATPLPIIPGNPDSNNYKDLSRTYYTLKLVFNGTDRFSQRNLNYFTRQQIKQHHTGFGSVKYPDSISVYSFALRPEEHQPSGTCNFSRFDNITMVFDSTDIADSPNSVFNEMSLDIYAVNYNIFRVMGGMGGLAYSN
jgi:hypothetical protein